VISKKKKPKERPASKKAAKAVVPEGPRQIVSRVSLKQIRMVHTESLVTNRDGSAPPQSQITVIAAFGRTDDGRTLGGELQFSLVSPPDSTSVPSIMIRCKLQLIYELTSGEMPSAEEVKAQESAITAMISFQGWPYVREFVHNMTLRMALPPLILDPLVVEPVREAPGTFRLTNQTASRQ
jgi:hypothetical protein